MKHTLHFVKVICISFFTTILFLNAIPINAQPGSLDSTFSNDGFVLTDIGLGSATANDVAIQADGKIVVVGNTGTASTSTDLVMVRYHADGSIDNSFASSGIYTKDFNSAGDDFQAVAIQDDGKICVAGYSGANLLVARFNDDGTPDNSFAVNGYFLSEINNLPSYANCLVIRDDGKILAGGGALLDAAVIRLNANGALDNSFGTNGATVIDVANGNQGDVIESIAFLPDDKILASGFDDNGNNDDYMIIRLKANGNPDSTFNLDGVATFFYALDDYAYDMKLKPDGNILLGGYSDFGGAFDFTLLQLDSTGSQDFTFSQDGWISYDVGGFVEHAHALLLQSDDKMILTGDSPQDFILVRFKANGERDSTFGTNGVVTTDLGFGVESINGATFQVDGKIVVCGFSGYNPFTFAVARYKSGLESGTNDIENSKKVFDVFPTVTENCFSVRTTLKNSIADSRMIISDFSGRILKSFSMSNQSSAEFCLGELSDGFYLCSLTENGRVLKSAKLILRK